MIHRRYLPTGLQLEVVQEGELLPVSQWIFLPEEDRALGGLCWRLWSAEEEGVEEGPEGLLLSGEALQHLKETELELLGVDRLGGRLQVSESGAVSLPGYHWIIEEDSRPVKTYTGWWIGTPPRLLTAPQRRLFGLAEAIPGAAIDDRFRAIAQLQRLAEEHPEALTTKGSLASRRVYEVTGVQIQVETDPERGMLPVAVPVGWSGGHQHAPPLTPARQAQLVNKMGTDGGRIPLGLDATVLVSRQAAANVYLTQLAREGTAEVRRDFIQNPTAFLPFEDAFDAEDYSERVIGVGELPPPPPRASSGLHWTERLGFWLEGPEERLWVDSSEWEEFFDAVSKEQGESLNWKGVRLPLTAATREVIARLQSQERKEQDQKAPVIVLKIQENSLVLGYEAWRGEPRPVLENHLPTLKISLKEHQIVGIQRLQKLWREGFRGALLCDDMGLGKTLQGLVFAAWARKQSPELPILLVAPLSLLDTWLGELERCLGAEELPVILWGQAEGGPGVASSRRIHLLRDFMSGKGGRDVVVQSNCFDLDRIRSLRPALVMVSYDSLRRYQFSYGKLQFGLVLADEAQAIKNDHSLRSRALRAMDYSFGLSLTGTPIENQWADLWTLCDYSLPGMLGSRREFLQDYPEDGAAELLGRRLAGTLKDVMIRRTRADSLPGLPPMKRLLLQAEMKGDQKLFYDMAASRPREGQGSGLALLQDLARISLHPEGGRKLLRREDVAPWVEASARLQCCWPLLRQWKEEERGVLLFVRSRRFQESLAQALCLDFGLTSVPVLSGAVPPAERSALVDRLRQGSGFRPMILSPDIGGVGWNLQFATRAVLMERPFNPAVEAQMLARIHRLGQEEAVEVLTPVATHPHQKSFDEVLERLLGGKLELAASVLLPLSVTEEELLEELTAL